MRRTAITIVAALAGCIMQPDEIETRQGPAVQHAPPEQCFPELTLHMEQHADGWHVSIAVEQRDCDGWGAGWNANGPECDAVADALRDACGAF